MSGNNGISSLDVMTVLLAYLSVHNYGENVEANSKLDTIILDIENKLNYQDELLEKILKKVEGLEREKD